MTRVFVMADIEGIAGVVSGQEGQPGNAEYERARRLMTAEANAAVFGILDAEPEAQVVVADAHGPFRNIVPEELDRRAQFVRGKPAIMGMVDGIGSDFDAAMFVGVHAKAGTGSSTLSHTFTGTILDVRLNGRSFGELGLNAAAVGAHGVPVVLVAGDQAVREEATALFGSDITTVVVKESRGHSRAQSLHPAVACEQIRSAAASAIGKRRDIAPLRVTEPVNVEVELSNLAVADMAMVIDGVERVDGRTIRASRGNALDAYRLLRLVTLLCSVSY
jgi:D-amino peptidase